MGLACVFLAPAAKADCPHGTKFIHPHCNVVEPPSGGIGVLRDAGGNIIGKVVGITRTSSITILFDAAGQTVLATVDGGSSSRTAGFSFGAIPGAGDVLFDNADCTGGAWLEVTNSDFFDEFRVPMIVGEENIDPAGFSDAGHDSWGWPWDSGRPQRRHIAHTATAPTKIIVLGSRQWQAADGKYSIAILNPNKSAT